MEATKTEAETIFEQITATLADKNGAVQVTTYLRSVLYQHKHRDMFRLRNGNIEVQRGKHWDALTIAGDYWRVVELSTGRVIIDGETYQVTTNTEYALNHPAYWEPSEAYEIADAELATI